MVGASWGVREVDPHLCSLHPEPMKTREAVLSVCADTSYTLFSRLACRGLGGGK